MGLQVLSRRTSVVAGFRAVARQINALEATGPAAEAAQAQAALEAARFEREAAAAKAPIAFPSPPAYAPGAGARAAAAPRLAHAGPGGRVTLFAQSGGGVAYEVDNCTFACQPYALSRGTFTARLLAVRLPQGGALAAGAKVGLMARETLGDASPALAVMFAGDRGVHAMYRPADGWKLNDQRPPTPATASGLIGQNVVQVPGTPAAGGNWLARPLWLRLAVDGTSWTAFTSLNGSRWTAVGSPWTVRFVGAWVGLFATSHQSGQTVEAVFDHVSGFDPGRIFQIGVY
jgi:hypothetical protein